ncbi:NADPH-dependent FMN reductase [Streptomyces sp. RTGN2]|uniref:NADPH-dependent FMN reductase n=1 Tax=Streptomyces sp. RTGN2 TaxID=3016525 RepID=UPI0025561D1E|nr:NADPH-dependent FMN reductase [Streptomyces sp. RTGN2]
MARVLAVAGSPTAHSRTSAVVEAAAAALARAGHRTELLRVRDLPAAALTGADPGAPGLREAAERVQWAEVLIIGTPVYKAGYSGLLKCWLDLLPQEAFAGRSVLPLATGGTLAHSLVVDYALRPVLMSLGASHIARGAFFADSDVAAGAEQPLAPSAAARLQRCLGSLELRLEQVETEPLPTG